MGGWDYRWSEKEKVLGRRKDRKGKGGESWKGRGIEEGLCRGSRGCWTLLNGASDEI